MLDAPEQLQPRGNLRARGDLVRLARSLYEQANADPGSFGQLVRASVLPHARELNQRLLQNPALLPELRAPAAPYVQQRTQGRGSPELTLVVSRV